MTLVGGLSSLTALTERNIADAFDVVEFAHWLQGSQPAEWRRWLDAYGDEIDQSVQRVIGEALRRQGLLMCLRFGIKTVWTRSTVALWSGSRCGGAPTVIDGVNIAEWNDRTIVFLNGIPVGEVAGPLWAKTACEGPTASLECWVRRQARQRPSRAGASA